MKVKVLKKFRDTHTKATHKPGAEIEMTKARYTEAVKNLAKWEGPFLEVIEDAGEKPKPGKKPEETPAEK